jgi:hypothetical protein
LSCHSQSLKWLLCGRVLPHNNLVHFSSSPTQI